MTAHLIVDIQVTDRSKFIAYANGVQDTVKAFGGKYLCKWGFPETLEGDWEARRIVIIEFPTSTQARQWWDSAEYQPLKKLRREASGARIVLVDHQ